MPNTHRFFGQNDHGGIELHRHHACIDACWQKGANLWRWYQGNGRRLRAKGFYGSNFRIDWVGPNALNKGAVGLIIRNFEQLLVDWAQRKNLIVTFEKIGNFNDY